MENKDGILNLEFFKSNKQKINDIEVLYRRTGTTHIYKELAELFKVSDTSIYYYNKKNKLSKKLELMFKAAKEIENGNENINFEAFKIFEQNLSKRMKRGLGSNPLTESEIRDAQMKAKSAFEASRLLGVSYNTYKKYARAYGILENLKNPYGIGVSKGLGSQTKKPKKWTEEQWKIHTLKKELKKRHLAKYHTATGEIDYACALYLITIPKGEKRKEYINKWGWLPIKIGISIDVITRFKNLLQRENTKYIDSEDPKWVEWNESAEIINIIPFYTVNECTKVESRIHTYLRDYRIEGIKSKSGGEAWELFNAPFEKINEGLYTYVTGWRLSKWDSNQMNNDYGYCKSIPFSILKFSNNYISEIGESEIGSDGKFF